MGALEDIKRLYEKDPSDLYFGYFIQPEVVFSPQKSFYSEKEPLPIRESAGRISGESVMCYPPGIPIISPGERVTNEIIEYILFSREKGCTIQGAADPRADYLQVIKE